MHTRANAPVGKQVLYLHDKLMTCRIEHHCMVRDCAFCVKQAAQEGCSYFCWFTIDACFNVAHSGALSQHRIFFAQFSRQGSAVEVDALTIMFSWSVADDA